MPNMPLVVPGVTSQSGDKTEEWMNKLVGKKLTEQDASNEIVSEKRANSVMEPKDEWKLTMPLSLC